MKDDEAPQGLGRASSIGFELVGLVVAGGALGYYLDQRWATKPWLLIGGVCLFSVVGLVRLVVEGLRSGKDPR